MNTVMVVPTLGKPVSVGGGRGGLPQPLISLERTLNAQFGISIGFMHLDGFRTDAEHFGSFLIGKPFSRKHKNFTISGRQRIVGRLIALSFGCRLRCRK